MIFSIASMNINTVFPKAFFKNHIFFSSVKKDYCLPRGKMYHFELVFKKQLLPYYIVPYNPLAIPHIINKSAISTIIYQNESICKINWQKKQAIVTLSERVRSPEMLFFDYLKLLFSSLLIQKGGLPLHSSAVSKNGNGIAFYGPSGVGKSTIAGLLSPDWKMLNDDVTFIVPYKGGYRMYSTPFIAPGKYEQISKGAAKLLALFLIHKQNSNSFFEMTIQEKIFSLTSSMFALPLSDSFSQKMLRNIEMFCKKVIVQKLSFKNDISILQKINGFKG